MTRGRTISIALIVLAISVTLPACSEKPAPGGSSATDAAVSPQAAPGATDAATVPPAPDSVPAPAVAAAPETAAVATAPAEATGSEPAAETIPESDTAVESPDTSEQDLPEISEAEKILWMGDQLKGIGKPSSLRYEFKKSGSYEEGFTDAISFHVTELLPDGKKRAVVEFFTGSRNHYVPPYDSIDGNVLLAIYLEGDVIEMARLTEGGRRYFQQRIKYALAKKAQMTDTELEFDGKKVPGRNITIAPYAEDPRGEVNEKFRKLKDKTYTFTVSDSIPGYLYQVHTIVPAPKDAGVGAPPLIEEYMRLVSVGPLEMNAKSVAEKDGGQKADATH